MDIKALIKRSEKTRSQILAEVGCSQSYLSLVESGDRKVGPKFLLKMARSLGVRPDDLRPDMAVYFRGDTLQAVNDVPHVQGQDAHSTSGGVA